MGTEEAEQLNSLRQLTKDRANAGKLAIILATQMAAGNENFVEHFLALKDVTELVESEYDTIVSEQYGDGKKELTVQDVIISGVRAAIAADHYKTIRAFNNCTILSRNIMDDDLPELLMEAAKPRTHLLGISSEMAADNARLHLPDGGRSKG